MPLRRKYVRASQNRNIRDDVATTLRQMITDVIEDHEDNLAMKIASSVKSYNPDWCAADASDKVAIKSDEAVKAAIDKIVQAELDALFANEE